MPALWQAADDDGVGLLLPNLALILSHAEKDATIDDLKAALADPEATIRPAFAAGPYWNEHDWSWFVGKAGEIAAILTDMQAAGFAAFLARYREALEVERTAVEKV